MMKHLFPKHVVMVALVCLPCVLAVPGCSEDTTKPVQQSPPEPDPRETRVGLIDLFMSAHEERDVVKYETCLHPDYEFRFSEDDRTAPGWPFGDCFDRAQDLLSTDHMFGAGWVKEIRLDLLNQSTVQGAETAEDRFFELDVPLGKGDTLTVRWADFLVDLRVVEETTEDQIDHWVDGRAYIYLAPDPADDTLWTVWKIEDKGNAHRKTEKYTWGWIKVLYRK
jgi:hypothetical protein